MENSEILDIAYEHYKKGKQILISYAKDSNYGLTFSESCDGLEFLSVIKFLYDKDITDPYFTIYAYIRKDYVMLKVNAEILLELAIRNKNNLVALDK